MTTLPTNDTVVYKGSPLSTPVNNTPELEHQAALELETRAAETFAEWRASPPTFVRDHFGVAPDLWQLDVLGQLLTSPRIAMSACKGPGKSAVLAWCAWWILACHPDAQGFALSITEDNLKDNLWKELSVWHDKSPVLQAMFEVRRQRIESKERPATWFLSARSYAQSADANAQANALSGLHSSACFILLDEVGDMPPGVVAAAKGIFSVVGQQAWLLAAGNPTSQEGALYWITTTDAARWSIVHISGDPDDPRRSNRIDIENARAEIAALGRDNPWVMTNILGLYPPVGANQLIGPNEVTSCMSRDVSALQYTDQPIVWGLDPAYSDKSGADEAVLARRQGIVAFRMHNWRGLDGTDLGDAVALLIEEARRAGQGPDRLFVDKGGVGTSCYDRLRDLGYRDLVVGVDFGGRAADSVRYVDKRTEMWIRLRDWLPQACLPTDQVLRAELVAPRCWFKRRGRSTKFILEAKDEMKSRGKASPNRADALALTFASPTRARSAIEKARDAQGVGRNMAATKYDPLDRARRSETAVAIHYDPLHDSRSRTLFTGSGSK